MRFDNWKAMYDFIVEGNDLWSPRTGTYVFVYNDRGAICTYNVDAWHAAKLNASSAEYWGAMLGPGGCILDVDEYRGIDTERYLAPSHDFCKSFCDIEWTECADKLAVEVAASAEIAKAAGAEPVYTVIVCIVEHDGDGEVLGDESMSLKRAELGAGYCLDAAEDDLIPCSELEAAVEAAKELAKAELARCGGGECLTAQLWVSRYDTVNHVPLDGIELMAA